jgi:hypothetical protein
MPTDTKRLATYRWMARQLHGICSWGTYDGHAHLNWMQKARAIDAAPRTIEGVIGALVNFPWMVEGAVANKKWREQAAAILAILETRELVENLPARAA